MCQDLLSGFPASEKLERLRSYFDSPTKLGPPSREDDADGWSNWEDNWDRVMQRGVLA